MSGTVEMGELANVFDNHLFPAGLSVHVDKEQ